MRFLILGGWIVLILLFILPLLGSLFRKSPSRKDQLDKGSELARDEVCGVYIPKDRAETLEAKGKLYYFCGKECQTKFLQGNG
ncbi:MAG: YHS domain-containing protein [Nitrospirae bacterium]|nr:YHS domain-containing protein [Nitrospirota bacterium]MBI3594877.1 YHS domain-containing protein [Nitrospirota bacterium]